MTASKELLKLVPTLQSLDLVSRNFKKKKKKNLIEQGTENIVGTEFIKTEADLVGLFD